MSNTREPWHLKKELNIGHLISTAMIVVTFAVYVHKMDTRLAVTEARLAIIERQVDENRTNFERELKGLASSIDARLNRIDDKLDKLIINNREQ